MSGGADGEPRHRHGQADQVVVHQIGGAEHGGGNDGGELRPGAGAASGDPGDAGQSSAGGSGLGCQSGPGADPEQVQPGV